MTSEAPTRAQRRKSTNNLKRLHSLLSSFVKEKQRPTITGKPGSVAHDFQQIVSGKNAANVVLTIKRIEQHFVEEGVIFKPFTK